MPSDWISLTATDYERIRTSVSGGAKLLIIGLCCVLEAVDESMNGDGETALFREDRDGEEDDSEDDCEVVEQDEYGAVDRFYHCSRVSSGELLGVFKYFFIFIIVYN